LVLPAGDEPVSYTFTSLFQRQVLLLNAWSICTYLTSNLGVNSTRFRLFYSNSEQKKEGQGQLFTFPVLNFCLNNNTIHKIIKRLNQ
jgi:hypothetical protein